MTQPGPSQEQWDAMLRGVAAQIPEKDGATFTAPENDLRPDPARLAQEMRLLTHRLLCVETFLQRFYHYLPPHVEGTRIEP